MKVILKSDVENLGKLGDVVQVKGGFARNYLLPRGFATVATERRMKELRHLLSIANVKKARILEAKKELLEKVSKFELTIKAPSSEESDKLFGSITKADISNALSEKGFDINKKDIVLKNNIKTAGEHLVKLHLAEELSTNIKVMVEKDLKDKDVSITEE